MHWPLSDARVIARSPDAVVQLGNTGAPCPGELLPVGGLDGGLDRGSAGLDAGWTMSTLVSAAAAASMARDLPSRARSMTERSLRSKQKQKSLGCCRESIDVVSDAIDERSAHLCRLHYFLAPPAKIRSYSQKPADSRAAHWLLEAHRVQ
jgi:hypothetical protein